MVTIRGLSPSWDSLFFYESKMTINRFVKTNAVMKEKAPAGPMMVGVPNYRIGLRHPVAEYGACEDDVV